MFIVPQKYSKLLSIVLIALIIITNPAFVVPVYAAASDDSKQQTTITIDKSSDEMTKDSGEKLSRESAHLTDNQKITQFINRVIPYYFKGGKMQGPEWLKTTTINLQFTEDHKPIFSFETIQPFSQASEDGQLWFWQGRYAYQSDSAEGNVGVGWRKLSPDKSQIFGWNTFYDYGFKYNLARIGLGIEYFNKRTEYRVNYYIPVSGDKQTGVGYSDNGIVYSYIRAVQGFDYEIGSSLVNAPWLGFYASGFYYDNKYKDDETGYKLRSKMQITPRFSLDLGYQHSNFGSGSFYSKFMYQLADCLGPVLYGGKGQDKKDMDLSYKLLQKVERNNTIKTETFTRAVTHGGNVSVTVTNSHAGNHNAPIAGVRLQAYDSNGIAVGNVVVTNSNGVGVISGLPVGTYQIKAAYFTLAPAHTQVAVTKGTTANTVISLDVPSANIVVNVYDANTQAVSGATVTTAAGTFTLGGTTDEYGQAHFNNLPPGNYRFTVNFNGKTMQSIPVEIPDNPIGGDDRSVDVVLPPNGTPAANHGSAVITVKSGTAVLANAEVTISGNGVSQTVYTNASGMAIFSNLAAGTYSLAASKENYNSSTGNSITIESGITKTDALALTMQTGNANVTVFSSGLPVEGAVVAVDGTALTGTTNASGVAAINDIPTGSYTFTVSKMGYNTASSGNVSITNGSTATTAINLSMQTFIITASAGAGGSITPSGTTSVSYSGSQTYTITADAGQNIDSIIVDGSSIPVTGSPQAYTFSNVTGSHTIAAAFAVQTFVITASAGAGGSITPGGTSSVSYNGSQAYTITADTGHSIASITVDGASVPVTGSPQTYTFSNVTGSHTIAATFAIQSFAITASAGAGGSISPGGTTAVNYNGSKSYTVTADSLHKISSISIDGGASQTITATGAGGSQTYTFTNVTANHTITAAFEEVHCTVTITVDPMYDTGSGQWFVEAYDNSNYELRGKVSVGASHVATMSNLLPGDYTFWLLDDTNSNYVTYTETVTLSGDKSIMVY